MKSAILELQILFLLASFVPLPPAHAQLGDWRGWEEITLSFGGPTDQAVASVFGPDPRPIPAGEDVSTDLEY